LELIIVVTLWSLGALAATGIPAFILLRRRLQWHRLPHTRAYVKGEGPSPAMQDDALLAFADLWGQHGFPKQKKLIEHFKELHIEWRFGDYFTDPKLNNGELKARGWTPSPKHIVVAIWNDAALGHTAFFHELTHVALWVLYNEPDPDHEGEKYAGWTAEHTAMISELKKEYSLRFGMNLSTKKQGLRVVSDDDDDEEVPRTPEGVMHCGSCTRDIEA
jgi:hypothetical protein